MIGIFDSGIGGLRVLREVRRLMPERDVVYYGDTARGPWGQKSPDTIESHMLEGLSRLLDMGAGLLVVTDHAAAACLTTDVRNRLSIPVLDILFHGVVPGLKSLSPNAVGMIGPPALEEIGAHASAVRETIPHARFYAESTPLLEPLVEAGWMTKPETMMILKKYLHRLKIRQIDTIVLGSNHYSGMASIIRRKIGKRITLIDPAPVLAREVENFLAEHPGIDDVSGKNGTCTVMVSDITDALQKNAKMFYGSNVKLEPLV